MGSFTNPTWYEQVVKYVGRNRVKYLRQQCLSLKLRFGLTYCVNN